MYKRILYLSFLLPAAAFAAPDSYCPNHLKIKEAVKRYAEATAKPNLSDKERETLKTALDASFLIYTIGEPQDVQNFCSLIEQRELLKALSDRLNAK